MSTRNYVTMQNKYSRVVLLVDMDCFYCQVEEKLDPTLKGQPLAVVQYNAWRGGGIIAVNYAARAQGVTRHMRGDEAQQQCPDIQLVKVPNVREKADLTKYREAGKEVANVLQRFTPLLERASVDEAYLDVTEEVNRRLGDMNTGSFMLQPEALTNSYAVGFNDIGDFVNTITTRLTPSNEMDAEQDMFAQAHDTIDAATLQQSDLRLLLGSSIACEVRAAVKAATGYECSAGIAHNKLLAKLACGINKPNKQTVLPLAQIPRLFETLPVGKITGLGGKFGEEICQRLDVLYMGQLLQFTEAELQRKFDEKNGTWLYNICRGIDLEAVTPRFYSKSIGCCKKFPGRNNITGLNTLTHWLGELANEVCERLEKDVLENNRRAKQMVVSYVQDFDGQEISSSRSAPLSGYDAEILAKCSLEVLQAHTKQFYRAGSTSMLNNPLKFLGISVGKFETIMSGQSKLQEMFANQAAKQKSTHVAAANVEANVGSVTNSISSHAKPAEAKKSTFLQNYLKNTKTTNALEKDAKSECKELLTTASDKSTAAVLQTDLHSGSDARQLETAATDSEQPAKKSFFLKALKAQRQDVPTAMPSSLAKQAELEERKSKSFFAKLLNKTAVEAVRKIEIEQSTESGANVPADATAELVAALQQIEPELPLDDNNVAYAADTNTPVVINSDSNKKRKYTELLELPIKRSNAGSTYETSYAEYAMPELRPEYLEFVKCELCGADVPADERSQQLHQDHHFAKQMSQQLREEYRTQVKTQMTLNNSSSTTAAASRKTKKSPNNAVKVDITKFLKPKQTNSANNAAASTAALNVRTASVDAAEDVPSAAESIRCDECQQLVCPFDLAEHKDFHVAKELQRKLNLLEVRTVTTVKKSTASTNLNNSQMARTLNASIKNTKPITQFFSQTNC